MSAGYSSDVLRLAACLVLALVAACQRGGEEAVVVSPDRLPSEPTEVPVDPFGAASPAYAELRNVTDATLSDAWSGRLEDFAPWLERQTEAIERARSLLKALRVGPQDEYAVALARIALVYEHVVRGLTDASAAAQAVGYEADWRDQQGLVEEQAASFWMRCVHLCGQAGAHVDAWALRCRRGLAESQAQSPRQPK